MKRSVALLCLVLVFTVKLSAQLSEGGLPVSQSLPKLKATVNLPDFKLRHIDKRVLLQEDEKRPTPFRYAVFEDINIDLTKDGRRDTLPAKGGTIWRLKIESDSAYSIQLILRKFVIPFGAKLFVYNENLTQVLGAFTCNNVQNDSTLTIADVIGNKAIIEYYEPAGADFNGIVIIGSVGKAYKDIYRLTSGTDYININCPEGKDLQAVKHAVCKISFRSDSSSFLCSGSLINNARQNEIPYFLTASHCISTSAEASTLIAYFNYENEGCNGTVLSTRSLSGATLLSTSPASDYTLLKLNDKPTALYQPYYAGWDANDVPADHISGVHHPEGLPKKLSVDNDTTVANSATIQWQGSTSSPVGSHWQVNFDEGKTAGGSSGSPLFNKKKQIIGQLHGGDNVFDLYGKFSYSWQHSSGKYPGLRTFLDPDSTGILSLDGHYPSTNPPDAFINVPVSQVCVQSSIKLTDYSAFGPYTRTWTISPATYTFADGTSSSSPNPVVQFLQAGNYSVKLKTANSNGIDSMSLINAFQAGTTINVNIASLPAGQSCFCTFDHFLAWASGASSYVWTVMPGSEDKIQLNRNDADTVTVSRVSGFKTDSSFAVNIKVTGTQGTCSDTADFTYDLVIQPNDSLRNATLIPYGKSAIYSNKCATVDPGEPIPPHYSCTTQYSWCDEYGTGQDIVQNSVWFKFVAAPEGHITISSSGFDNELALYDAASYADILSNNYVILAANDDRSATDFNPLLRSVAVTPGKTYWIQVDGSGGGLQDNFFLQLTALVVTDLPGEKSNSLIVYPQPATDIVYFKGNGITSQALHVTVYSSVGILIDDEMVNPSGGVLAINVNSWEKGIYIVRIGSDVDGFVTRFIKY